jgi:hypothetical protein
LQHPIFSADPSDSMRLSDLALAQRRKAASRGRAQIAENRKQRRDRWRAEALSLWRDWRQDPLFVLGVGLYWGEGDKSSGNKRLALSNADPRLLRTWLRWCGRFLPGVRLNFWLCVHDECDVAEARAFWKQELNQEVTWASVAVSRASNRRRRSLPHGTLKVSLGRGSLEWYTKMLVWLELAQGI